MKHRLLYGLAAVLMAASCQTQELLSPELTDSDSVVSPGMREMIITAETEGYTQDTRTSLVINEDNSTMVLWTPGDEIEIFSAGESAKFTAINTEPSRKAKFRGQVSMIFGEDEEGGEKDYVWGLYPYREDAVYSEPDGEGVSRTAVITTTIPSEQEGKPGSFSDGQATMIGRSEASLLISYKNAYSGVFVRFNRNDIVSVTVRGLHNETLAGRVTLGLDSNNKPYVKEIVSPKKEVTITDSENGTFVSGQNYFLLTLPDVDLQEGYSLTVKRSDGMEATFNSLTSVDKFVRNEFRHFNNPLDTYIEDAEHIKNKRSSGWRNSSPQDNEIIYRTSDAEEYAYAVDDNTGNEVVENIAPKDNVGQGIIRFQEPITEIDNNAFYRNGSSTLTSVILPSSVETIGTGAFANCSSLRDISLSGNLKTIMPNAFNSCSFESINLPDGLEEICYDAFRACNIKSIDIPESVTLLGTSSSSELIGNPFAGCYYLESFSGKFATSDGRALVIDYEGHDYLISVATYGLETYSVPQVYGIGNVALYASELKHVDLPDGLVSIGDYAFGFSSNLESIVIPASVTSIGSFAFVSNSKLQTVRIECPSVPEITKSDYPSSWSKGNVFNGCTSFQIFVPISLIDTYKDEETEKIWSGYADKYVAYLEIPDAAFKAYLLDSRNGLDLDGDGFLSLPEAQAIEIINYWADDKYNNFLDPSQVSNWTGYYQAYSTAPKYYCYGPISSFEGLEYMIGLKKLMVYSCNSSLTDIDISNNTELTSFCLSSCYVSSIDISKNTELKTLEMNYLYRITSLDLSNNTKLTSINLYYLLALNDLLLPQAENLQILNCQNSSLTSLVVSPYPNLKQLRCSNNQLTELDLSNNPLLTDLYCYNNQITELDVSGINALNHFECTPMNSNGSNVLQTIYVSSLSQPGTNWKKPEDTEYVIKSND